jgi:hypothetical protein
MQKRATPCSLCGTAIATCGLVLGATPAYTSITSTPGYFHLANAG